MPSTLAHRLIVGEVEGDAATVIFWSCRLLGRAVAWLTLLMVLLTCAVVLLRYGFSIGATATQEVILYAHSLVFLGAAAWALQRDAHVRVDIFYRRMGNRGKALIDLLGSLLFLLPMCLFLAWNCWDYVAMSWQRQERSADAGGLPWVYLHKSFILLLHRSRHTWMGRRGGGEGGSGGTHPVQHSAAWPRTRRNPWRAAARGRRVHARAADGRHE